MQQLAGHFEPGGNWAAGHLRHHANVPPFGPIGRVDSTGPDAFAGPFRPLDRGGRQ